MNQYTIKHYHKVIEEVNGNHVIKWSAIDALTIDKFPWYSAGEKQYSQVKLCSNADNLFIQFIAKDQHSSSKQTQLNHAKICDDSCVEFFFTPSGILGGKYINVEINCCGVLHVAYGASREDRTLISPTLAGQIHCRSSIRSTTKSESTADVEWTIDMTLPFHVIEKFSGEKINASKWYANFYRCGGVTEPQFAVWQNVATPRPDYHQPKYFGELTFSK